jgi:hypothetical protein
VGYSFTLFFHGVSHAVCSPKFFKINIKKYKGDFTSRFSGGMWEILISYQKQEKGGWGGHSRTAPM